MKSSTEESRRWIAQAANDLQFAKLAFSEKFYSQCCFVSQQAAEKAVKALHYQMGERIVIGHSVNQLLGKLKLTVQEDLKEVAKILDQFYIATRYPNGLPGGAPFEVFTRKQAEEAVKGCEQIYVWALENINKIT